MLWSFDPEFYISLFLYGHVSCKFISLLNSKIIVSTDQSSWLWGRSRIWKFGSDDDLTQFINFQRFIKHNSSLSIKSSSNSVPLSKIDLQLSNGVWFLSLKVLLKLNLLGPYFFLSFSFLSPSCFFSYSFSVWSEFIKSSKLRHWILLDSIEILDSFSYSNIRSCFFKLWVELLPKIHFKNFPIILSVIRPCLLNRRND